MPFNVSHAKLCISNFDFRALFVEELGWEVFTSQIIISVDSKDYLLKGIAEKRGMVILVCQADAEQSLPHYPMRRKIERQLAKNIHEHVIIYIDDRNTYQIWQWVKHEPGRPTACREHTYYHAQPGDSLVQKLQSIAFSLEEEERLSLIDVTGRVRAAFDVERITRRFYDRFKKEHDTFLKFIDGIPDSDLKEWYASVMLNRLMFIYFIQKKGFLNNDIHYLKNKLIESKKRGKDLFYTSFLCPLFFDGFAKKFDERSLEINQLLGTIPYLNGGLFLRHQVEELHGETINIPDKAFEKLLDFFDQYQWHLDERPLRADNEINPDVLGYIFEKYINQKQMGAYYSKEDITEYISKNTVIPFLFDQARELCTIAFEGDQLVWRLLQSAPDWYIYEAVRRGVVDEQGSIIPESALPDFVQKGMHDPKARMFDKQYNLGEAFNGHPDKDKFALPTETWREYIERRKRCLELRQKLAEGEIQDINDLITYNLDIRQFAQDVVENCEGPELLRAFYQAIEDVTVLDPTCGSGAFLFAALNILEPLYEACLNRMEVFVQESELLADEPERYEDFREILKRVSEHPNLSYFIFKSIILNNLYGVDIMKEAIEICKLRLFLKLVAQIDDVDKIEPLPDIDFNIRAGNTLVGFTSLEEVERTMTSSGAQTRLVSEEENVILKRLKQKGSEVAVLFNKFREKQTSLDGEATKAEKEKLQNKLQELEEELNGYLAVDYGVDIRKQENYKSWLHSHKPFHWFIEFYGIISRGGFDVIIGNPPYVEYSKVRDEYTIRGYETESCGNLYAYVLERSFCLLKRDGLFGMIVPVSSISGDDYRPLSRMYLQRRSWVSSFSNRPGKLFAGVEQRLAIFIIKNEPSELVLTSSYQHWYESERPVLFNLLSYTTAKLWTVSGMPIKSGCEIAEAIFELLTNNQRHVLSEISQRSGSYGAYFHDGPTYWVRVLPFEPNTGIKSDRSNHYHRIPAQTKAEAFVIASILSSTIFYFFFKMVSNCRDLGNRYWSTFPVGEIEESNFKQLAELGTELGKRLSKTAKLCEREYPSGVVAYEEYYPYKAKDIIDNIDCLLSNHFGLSSVECDFILNYQVKYRIGQEADEENAENTSQSNQVSVVPPLEPAEEEEFVNRLPLYSLKAAAGKFGEGQDVEEEGWIGVDIGRKLDEKMFVAQVVGKSMEPRIPDGSYCIFRAYPEGTRQGKIVLVQHHDIDDPDTGGRYTVKVYESEKILDKDASWKHSVIRLKPFNPNYEPIELRDVDEGSVQLIAEFVAVLPARV